MTDTLTHTEREIAVLVASGLTNGEIASRLCLSHGTVRNYISLTFDKLHITNRAALAIYALRNDLTRAISQPAPSYDPDDYREIMLVNR